MTEATERSAISPSISLDGRFAAFMPGATTPQVEVIEIETGRRWTISTDGGFNPMWSPEGSEIFYVWGASWFVVDVTTEPESIPSTPRHLFDRSLGDTFFNYDVRADGQRFLHVAILAGPDEEQPTPRINVVLNWFEELKQRVPTGR